MYQILKPIFKQIKLEISHKKNSIHKNISFIDYQINTPILINIQIRYMKQISPT